MKTDLSPATETGVRPAQIAVHALLAGDWECLTASFVEHYRTPVGDEFASEVVVVPSPGHERALSQRLARTLGGPDGVCAGFDFVSLRALRRRLDARLLKVDATHDPWRRRGLTMATLDAITTAIDEPEFALLRHHLQSPQLRPGRQLAVARRIGERLLDYANRRPDMVAAWSAGHDLGPDGEPLPADQIWQAIVWRRVSALLSPVPNPSVRHDQLMAAIANADIVGLPARLGVITVNALASRDLAMLDALSQRVPLTWWYLGESTADELASAANSPLTVEQVTTEQMPTQSMPAERCRGTSPVPAYVGPAPTTHLGGGSNGFRARYGVLRNLGVRQVRSIGQVDILTPDDQAASSVLARMQTGIRTGQPPQPSFSADSSLQIHACHGPDRQVEVLREVLCGLFDADHSLQPRDVLVLCTDLVSYAPLLSADFCLQFPAGTRTHPGQRLRVQLAGSAVRNSNPVLEVVADVLGLPNSRAEVDQLIELCSRQPVANRFGFDTADLEALTELVTTARVRWGIDSTHRRSYQLGSLSQGTWLAGLDRLLAGVALAPEPATPLGTVLPVADITAAQFELVGRLAELISRLRRLWLEFSTPASMSVWVQRLRGAIDDLCEVEPQDNWQLAHAIGELTGLTSLAGEYGAELTCADVSVLFGQLLRDHPGRPQFGNGCLQVCQLGDLQGVQHRVVCILGLDDAHFPTRQALPADDILADDPLDAALDSRVRSRELLLDAVLAAQDQLIIITKGGNEATGAQLPAGVAILDVLRASGVVGLAGRWRTGNEQLPEGVHALVRHHTMQPYTASNFYAEDGVPFSFDPNAYDGAQARCAAQPAAPMPWWQRCFEAPPTDPELDITTLIRFYRDPGAQLLRMHGVSLFEQETKLSGELPLELKGLDRYQVGTELTNQTLAGADLHHSEYLQRLDGLVPAGRLGDAELASIEADVEQLTKRVRHYRGESALHTVGEHPIASSLIRWTRSAPRTVECSVHCRTAVEGTHLTGRLDLYGNRLVGAHFGKIRGRHLAQSWIELLLLAASPEGQSLNNRPQAIVIGTDEVWTLTAPDPQLATHLLTQMAITRQRGLSQLLPLPPDLGAVDVGVTSAYGYTLAERLTNGWADLVKFEPHWSWLIGEHFIDLLEAPTEPNDPCFMAGITGERAFPPGAPTPPLGAPVSPLRGPIAAAAADPAEPRFHRLAAWFYQPIRAALAKPADRPDDK